MLTQCMRCRLRLVGAAVCAALTGCVLYCMCAWQALLRCVLCHGTHLLDCRAAGAASSPFRMSRVFSMGSARGVVAPPRPFRVSGPRLLGRIGCGVQEIVPREDGTDPEVEQLELDFDSDIRDIRLRTSSLTKSRNAWYPGWCRVDRGFVANIPSDWSLRKYLEILYHAPHFALFLRKTQVCCRRLTADTADPLCVRMCVAYRTPCHGTKRHVHPLLGAVSRLLASSIARPVTFRIDHVTAAVIQ